MKRILLTGLGVLIPTLMAAMASAQEAGIPSQKLSPRLRLETYVVPRIVLHNSTTTGTAARTVGREEVVASISLASVTALDTSSGFGVPSRPGKLVVDFFDSGGGSTIACSELIISGTDVDGRAINDRLTSLVEAGIFTTSKSFVTVSRVRGTCSGGGASDTLILALSNSYELPKKIAQTSDVISICASDLEDATGTPNKRCVLPSNCSSAVDIRANTVDVSTCDSAFNTVNAGPLADGDTIEILYRGTGRL